MVPPDDFSANIGENEDSEGPFAMIEDTMIGQEDVLGLVILYIVAVEMECSDVIQVDIGLLVLADTVEINRRHRRGLEKVELLYVFSSFGKRQPI